MEDWARALPEDTIEYCIYTFPQKGRLGSESRSTIRDVLRDVKKSSAELLTQHLKGYIWQRESFSLALRDTARDDAGEICLHGRTNFGDSIEDEWLIVWLMRELSKQYPQIWVRVTDSMGEFLLVEAANVLPSWLDPETAENRVWINKGDLRLIPAARARFASDENAPASEPLTLADVRRYIFSEKPTLHPQLVEKEAFHRLRNYPKQIEQNQHHSILIIPRKLAYLLHESPSYIGPAIDAFYLRDPIAMKPLMSSNNDSLALPPRDFVTMRVRFTRVGYAQVKSQRFNVPLAWQGAEKGYEDARFRERAETGMKVTAGFEMLLGDPQRQDERVVREVKLLLEEVDSGDAKLPSDDDVRSWGTEADDEKWMDINFRDFEDELSGKNGGGARGETSGVGFGDKAAQENLRKMVGRFEDFLNDDTLDADDFDDDSGSGDENEKGGNGENERSSFMEDDFTKMMCELMDMPEEVMREIMTAKMPKEEIKRFSEQAQHQQSEETTSADHEGDYEELRQLSAAMEAELKGLGALNLPDHQKRKDAAKIKNKSSLAEVDEAGEDNNDSDDGELLDEDYNLVSNMLESFKGQSGMAGPGGNLMGLMGVKLPRDEEHSGDDESGIGSS